MNSGPIFLQLRAQCRLQSHNQAYKRRGDTRCLSKHLRIWLPVIFLKSATLCSVCTVSRAWMRCWIRTQVFMRLEQLRGTNLGWCGARPQTSRGESVLVQRNLYCTRPAACCSPSCLGYSNENRSGPWAPVLGEFEDLSNKLLLLLLLRWNCWWPCHDPGCCCWSVTCTSLSIQHCLLRAVRLQCRTLSF